MGVCPYGDKFKGTFSLNLIKISQAPEFPGGQWSKLCTSAGGESWTSELRSQMLGIAKTNNQTKQKPHVL